MKANKKKATKTAANHDQAAIHGDKERGEKKMRRKTTQPGRASSRGTEKDGKVRKDETDRPLPGDGEKGRGTSGRLRAWFCRGRLEPVDHADSGQGRPV